MCIFERESGIEGEVQDRQCKQEEERYNSERHQEALGMKAEAGSLCSLSE